MPVRQRKTITIEDLRQALGEKEADAVLSRVYPVGGAPVNPKFRIEKGTLAKVLAAMNGEQTGTVPVVPTTFKLYFWEYPHRRNVFKSWLEERLKAIESGQEIEGMVLKAESPVAHAPRKKRKDRMTGTERTEPVETKA